WQIRNIKRTNCDRTRRCTRPPNAPFATLSTRLAAGELVVRGNMSEFVRIREWPPDYAEKVFADGYYLEALQTLHGWIERKLTELLLLQRVRLGASNETWNKAWDTSIEFSLINAAKALFVIGALSEKE